MENNQNYLMVALQLLGSLGLLIFGMRLMSEALQKMAGPQLRHILAKMTTNRITGMLPTGISPSRTMASVSLPSTCPAPVPHLRAVLSHRQRAQPRHGRNGAWTRHREERHTATWGNHYHQYPGDRWPDV